MKKILSIGLSVALTMSTFNTSASAIGYNKVVDNELGGKTTYVGSENLEAYMEQLKAEMDEVKRKYEDKYKIHPWKGFLMELTPIFLATVLNISIGFAMKIFNYIVFRKSLGKSQAYSKNSDAAGTSNSRAVSPIPQSNAEASGFWKNSELSVPQTLVLSLISGVTTLFGLIKSSDYTSLIQSFEATEIWDKNKWIIEELTDAINNPDKTVRIYGAEIVCEPSDFLDKINTRCFVNSQKRFFTPGSKHYDPDLAKALTNQTK